MKEAPNNISSSDSEHLSILALTEDIFDKFRADFENDDKNRLAQNVVSKSNPIDACLRRKALEVHNHSFTHKVEEVKPVTNQRSSGRCWIFACLNAIRVPFMKAMNLEEFEFSQGHLYFWNKIETANYFLHAIAESYRRSPKEEVGGRLVSFLLDSPVSDGGQWDMIVNLVRKHGVMPKKCFPDAWSAAESNKMNAILKSKLREYARAIHKCIDAGNNESSLKNLIHEQMANIFRIVSICLGTPPKEFTWEYLDKSKKYGKVGAITPLDFYHQHVRAHFDIENKVCLVNDPRPSNPTGRTYSVDYLGNIVGGKQTVYNNQPMETLIEAAAKSIRDGEPVWFGCDVMKRINVKQGIMDTDAHDYALVFGTEVGLNLSKAERLIYGESCMSHAMVLTGVTVTDEENGDKDLASRVAKWRIENSWGEDTHEKGFLAMTTEWFKEFAFEVVVDKKYCSQEVLDVFELEPKILPAWDPMGALARA